MARERELMGSHRVIPTVTTLNNSLLRPRIPEGTTIVFFILKLHLNN